MLFLNRQINLPSPPMSPAKDPGDYPAFSGYVSRFVWRIYTQRLTAVGRWFALLSLAFISYSGASLQLQGYVPAAYFGAVWVVAVVAMLLWRPRVTATLRVGERVCVGEVLPLEVVVTNLSRLRGGDLVVLPHRLPRWLDAIPEGGLPLPDLAIGESHVAHLAVRCARRGAHEIRGVRVESGFPFGLLRSRRTFHDRRKIVVYPAFRPLSRLTLPTGRRYQPGGVALASELGESFEYLGNREYREGDNIRDIDWRATARVGGGTPIVREWVEEYMLRVAVVLDTHIPAGGKRKAREAKRETFEHAVSVAASVSDYMARQDYLVDLFAAGPNLYHLTAGRSLAYLEQILDILACVEESPDATFSIIEPQLSDLLDRLSTVILVLTSWDDVRQNFTRLLAERGVAVKVIILSDTLTPAETDNATLITKAMFEQGVEEL